MINIINNCRYVNMLKSAVSSGQVQEVDTSEAEKAQTDKSDRGESVKS